MLLDLWGSPSQARPAPRGAPPTPSAPKDPRLELSLLIKVKAPGSSHQDPPAGAGAALQAPVPAEQRGPHSSSPQAPAVPPPPRRPDSGSPRTVARTAAGVHCSCRCSPRPHPEKPATRPPASAARPALQGRTLPAATSAALLTTPTPRRRPRRRPGGPASLRPGRAPR